MKKTKVVRNSWLSSINNVIIISIIIIIITKASDPRNQPQYSFAKIMSFIIMADNLVPKQNFASKKKTNKTRGSKAGIIFLLIKRFHFDFNYILLYNRHISFYLSQKIYKPIINNAHRYQNYCKKQHKVLFCTNVID